LHGCAAGDPAQRGIDGAPVFQQAIEDRFAIGGKANVHITGDLVEFRNILPMPMRSS
jgi:hypothetical protein